MGKRHGPEEIVGKLREAEAAFGAVLKKAKVKKILRNTAK